MERTDIKPKFPKVREEDTLGKILNECFSNIKNIFESEQYDSFYIYSDYSGKTNGDYHTYSFLITPIEPSNDYYQEVCNIRKKYLCERGELSFKKMRQNKRMFSVVQEILPASSQLLAGVLFNVCVDKKINSLFSDDQRNSKKILKLQFENEGFENININSIESALRISCFFSYLVSLALLPKHILFWMSDNEDDFYPDKNENIRQEFLQLLERVIPNYAKEPFKFINFNVQGAIDVKWHRELVSLVDISAAGVNDILTAQKRGEEVKPESKAIAEWLSEDEGDSLQKINVLISKEGNEIFSNHVDIKYHK